MLDQPLPTNLTASCTRNDTMTSHSYHPEKFCSTLSHQEAAPTLWCFPLSRNLIEFEPCFLMRVCPYLRSRNQQHENTIAPIRRPSATKARLQCVELNTKAKNAPHMFRDLRLWSHQEVGVPKSRPLEVYTDNGRYNVWCQIHGLTKRTNATVRIFTVGTLE